MGDLARHTAAVRTGLARVGVEMKRQYRTHLNAPPLALVAAIARLGMRATRSHGGGAESKQVAVAKRRDGHVTPSRLPFRGIAGRGFLILLTPVISSFAHPFLVLSIHRCTLLFFIPLFKWEFLGAILFKLTGWAGPWLIHLLRANAASASASA